MTCNCTASDPIRTAPTGLIGTLNTNKTSKTYMESNNMANKKKERNPHNETNSISPTLSYIHNGMQVTISFAKSTVIFLRSSSTGISAVKTTFSSSFGLISGFVSVVFFTSAPISVASLPSSTVGAPSSSGLGSVPSPTSKEM